MNLFGAIVLAAGVLLILAAFLLKSKTTLAVRISLAAAGVLLGAVSALILITEAGRRAEDQVNTLVALRYLEEGNPDSARYYLKEVEHADFVAKCTEVVFEYMRGNETLGQLKQNGLAATAKKKREKTMVSWLSDIDPGNLSTQQEVAEKLTDRGGYSDKRIRQAEAQYAIENGNWDESSEKYRDSLKETERIRLDINAEMNRQNYRSAVHHAATLVSEKPSSDNRLLLAETIADSTYHGDELEESDFIVSGEQTEDRTREIAKLSDSLDAVNIDIEQLQEKAERLDEPDDALTKKMKKLLDRQEKLSSQIQYLYCYRALNSIADIYSFEAQIVRARLYFAMNRYGDAVDLLAKASASPVTRLTARTDVRNAMQVFHDAKKEGTNYAASQSPEFIDAMATLVSSAHPAMSSVATGELTRAFSVYISNDMKTYGRNLYASNIDTSKFPEIVVTVNGKDTILDEIRQKSAKLVLKDTGEAIADYEVILPDGTDGLSNICCVVDRSGSMGGKPIEDLKSALDGFVGALGDHAQLGIVAFESSAETVLPMTTDRISARQTIESLNAGGGTDITAGIREAVDHCDSTVGVATILLMTDGQSSIDMNVVEEAADAGYVINTIGFGDVNDELLREIAEMTGGQYIRAEESSELINVYLSLAGIVGNAVQIRYHAGNTDETVNRYFFLHTDDSAMSLRRPYSLTQPEKAITVTNVQPALLDVNGFTGDTRIVLEGDNLSGFTKARIGGQDAVIENADANADRLEILLSAPLKGGFQDIELSNDEGAVLILPERICVGEMHYGCNFTLGALTFRPDRYLVLPDNTLVFGNAVNLVCEKEENKKTFSARAEGILSFAADAAVIRQIDEDPNGYRGGAISCGSSGTLTGRGRITLNGDDPDYDNQGRNRIAVGDYELSCDQDQIRIILKENE
ncbi:MAG: VWA domain-containing protein [Lachnospiraceae bacterium]|nr:VWA domain-containing protein [Lachnospiraceae bacterium]